MSKLIDGMIPSFTHIHTRIHQITCVRPNLFTQRTDTAHRLICSKTKRYLRVRMRMNMAFSFGLSSLSEMPLNFILRFDD